MKTFLDRYIISTNFLLLLIILSLAYTQFYSSNVLLYFFLATVTSASTFFVEFLFNKANYERKIKAKRMAVYIMPFNIIIFAVATYFLQV
ncbi:MULTISPECIES: hypothetical protein [unclassified Paenibacillus]|uniref:hypothetical protein n=1 Tax=unclassified Paenibacillus TaxID=185978 RepID=UPI0004659634|nr:MULTISPECIES: hypothetical protein [unclassified Paenibacillus]KGP84553.1 hypothetical protein P364_0103800 [Paenibacillus sp. MAEPY2]KGP86720.1 hypothetical protein P363_0115475 [Paenibacillus sp. MAEPY1]MDN8591555.1 hypothetical protein [Paenibacillus sp. 11B]OPG95486.1 hypothetical protein B2I21_25790 [Chryseobacterium mucoviscidosis]